MAHKFFCLIFLFFAAQLAIADTEEVRQTASEIYSEILSPFCPGRLLSDCPSGAASKLKNEIREKLAAGASKEEVIADLYTVYGDEVRAAPEFRSFGMVAWLTPALFLFAGFALIAYWLARNSGRGGDDSDEKLLL